LARFLGTPARQRLARSSFFFLVRTEAKETAMKTLGEYRLRRLVGEGGMGKVYEAEERLTGRRVALKVLRPELARSDAARRLFCNEMAILAHLDHPNVVRSLACAEIDAELVMALEYLEGQTLRQLLLERGRLGVREAAGLCAQIASALGAAHRQRPVIVHRDLKPENVMVLPGGVVKVMDFGIAKVLEAAGGTTTHSIGTLQYMSPEQIDAVGVDARSDLYCLGLLLYEMLVGKPPFESASPRELLNLQCTASPPALPDAVRSSLPAQIAELLKALLQKAPDDRPSNAEAVRAALEPHIGALLEVSAASSSDAPESPTERTPSPLDAPTSASPRADPVRDTLPSVRELRSGRVPRRDTLALVERVMLPRTVSRRTGALALVVASLLSVVLTYGVRRVTAAADENTPALAETARAGTEP
jgi:serine/threonine protein kinase